MYPTYTVNVVCISKTRHTYCAKSIILVDRHT